MTAESQKDGATAGLQALLRRRLALLDAVTNALTEESELAGVLRRTLDAVVEISGVSGGGIFLLDEETGEPRLVVHRGVSEALARSFETNPSRTVRALATDPSAPLIVSNFREHENRRPEMTADGIKAYAAIPLRARGRPVGVLVAHSTSRSEFDEPDVALLVAVGRQIGFAIERARLHDAGERSLRRVQAFQEIAATLTASLDLQTTLDQVLDVAMEIFGADRAALAIREPGGRRMHGTISRNLSPAYLEAIEALTTSPGWKDTVGDGTSVYIPDVREANLPPALAGAVRAEGFRSTLHLPLHDGDEGIGTLVLYHDAVHRYSPQEVTLARTFADQATVAIRHARLFAAERQARERAATILEATRQVAGTLEFEDVLRQAGRWMAAALHQPSCGIWLLNDDETALNPAFRVSESPEPERDQRFRSLPSLPIARLPAGFQRLMIDREAIVVDTAVRPPNEVEREIQRLIPFDAYAAIPIAARDRVLGVATVVLDDIQALRPADIDVAAAIARSTALAVENARLLEQSRRLAASEERNRLARELHDSVTHALFSMSLIAQALPALMERDAGRARERVERLQELSRGALAEMRSLIFQLRPAALEEYGLVPALERHTAGFESREGVRVDLRVEGGRRLPHQIEETCYRVAQEALNNVAKHARATLVEVRLRITADDVTLTVRDDGAGFDPDALPPERRGLGLPGIRERAALTHGVAAIESAPGRGTTVRLTLPLRDGTGAAGNL